MANIIQKRYERDSVKSLRSREVLIYFFFNNLDEAFLLSKFQVGAAVVIFKKLGNQKQSDHSQWQLFPIHKLK
ncbi:hypothetical protein H5410_038733 [Solanum commersonii]|uniref:Uncharacterized protein n=1 Tax=Solanum commersonii TaxID=4109 RepID=A0A9J5YBJ5_SOLCO|nr:hypothetical protein H5410_038733 [Solanum commersonii]